MELVGRLVEASNATFLARHEGRDVVYKPVAGEAPLWDFPRHSLGRREVAAHALSEAAGFGVVPLTRWVEDGPFGAGSLQDWVEADGDELAQLVPLGAEPEGWFAVVEGVDADENEVVLVHADHPGLRRLALFDVVVNNADRKAGHILRRGEEVFGIDHGVCFHQEDKLRSILWGWADQPLTQDERALVERVLEVAEDSLGPWLHPVEAAACLSRARQLLESGRMPSPGQRWPVIPWPPI